MASDENFYSGGSYGLDYNSKYSDEFVGYRTDASTIGLALDARTAAQLQEVSTKLSTGAKVVEVQGLTGEVWESIPKQHLEEINRLRKLVGAEITFHGPLVEPTGVSRQGWAEEDRTAAERQIISAVERSHAMNPEGNLVITFHASNGLPEPETKILEDGKTKVKSVFVVDERTGQFSNLQLRESPFLGATPTPEAEINKLNEENWFKKLSHVNFQAHSGRDVVESIMKRAEEDPRTKKLAEEGVLNKYYATQGTEEGRKILQAIPPEARSEVENSVFRLDHGYIYIRDAYNELKNLFDEAYEAAKKEGRDDDLRKLNEFKAEIQPKLKNIQEPAKIAEFGHEIVKGVNVLRTIATPQVFRPLESFAMEKASETFSNAAIQSYKKFRETAPIISIENPPAGSGLSRADDIRKLIEQSREKFVEKAKKEMHLSESEAKKQAEKLLGATWDVGHINLIRQFGYGEKETIEETKKIAPYVKHVHLSDNFGLTHTELPMGMGNVPVKQQLELIEKYNKQVKKIAETGTWYQHFKTPPFSETLAAFGSPVYGMKMAPYWNQAAGAAGVPGYFSGYGLNPDIHHSIYGSGFSGLPVELGGQAQGGRSRMGGAPIE